MTEIVQSSPWRFSGGVPVRRGTSRYIWQLPRRARKVQEPGPWEVLFRDDIYGAVLKLSARYGGMYLGTSDRHGFVYSNKEHAVMVLGPPRVGKTSALVVPAILSATGPVVSTSVKNDVMNNTLDVRARLGPCWVFDPTGTVDVPIGAQRVRWSPLQAAASWNGAIRVSIAMVRATATGQGAQNGDFFARQAEKLLAPLLYACSVGDRTIGDVLKWANSMQLSEACGILETSDDPDAEIALSELEAIENSPSEQRGGVFATASNTLLPYRSSAAQANACQPNFDIERFVRSDDGPATVYIAAATDDVAAVAPIVVAFLDEVRRATYRAHTNNPSSLTPVLFALDEVANIAPMHDLPMVVSQGGGQGLLILACFQDLTQATARWGEEGKGFLSTFGTLVVLPGVKHRETLEALSLLIGDYDRRMTAYSRTKTGNPGWFSSVVPSGTGPSVSESRTESTQRQRILPPDEISKGRAGKALVFLGGNESRWGWLNLSNHYDSAPWPYVKNQLPCPPPPWWPSGT
jgi:type IV secretion system protein VirD4